MTRIGTPYFVSLAHAIAYYRPYGYDDVRAAVQRKLAEGEIHLGAPPLKAGERLTLIDEGKRYAIESD